MIRHGRRRLLRGGLALAGLGLLAGCGVSPPPAHPARKRPRLGFLSPWALGATPELAAFLEGLRARGYVAPETIEITYRAGTPSVPGRSGEGGRLALELPKLVESGVDALVAVQDQVIRLAKEAARATPIVMIASGEPVRAGLVASLARPGGNVTGVTGLVPELAGKRLELLKATVPGISRVGFVWNSEEVDDALVVGEVERAAQSLGLHPVLMPISSVGFSAWLEAVAEAARTGRIAALVVDYYLEPSLQQPRVVGVAAGQRLPTIYASRDPVASGGLMAYGPDRPDLFRRAAGYVDKILTGARPADLPVEQPTRFDLIVNLRTAQALGLTVPVSVLEQATEIIQ